MNRRDFLKFFSKAVAATGLVATTGLPEIKEPAQYFTGEITSTPEEKYPEFDHLESSFCGEVEYTYDEDTLYACSDGSVEYKGKKYHLPEVREFEGISQYIQTGKKVAS